MITSDNYLAEHISSIAEPLGNRGDKKIIEKVLYALTLLEQLKLAGLDFIFKGGTSLLLLYKTAPRRFSIDIDIITSVPETALLAYLERVIASKRFLRYVPDNDRKHAADMPVSHYKFYFKSAFGTLDESGEEPILLDVLFASNPYPQLRSIAINHPWLITDGNDPVIQVPEIESITGDKLTAFAPTTTGILYEKNRPVEVIKQLFDIGFLFDSVTDVGVIRGAYIRVAKEEIAYRKLPIEWHQSLEDTIEACVVISQRDHTSDKFQFMLKGVKNIVNFILTRFHIEEAIVCASKTAYISALLLTGKDQLLRYSGPEQVRTIVIGNPRFQKMNKLKKMLPEAFYYWSEVANIL